MRKRALRRRYGRTRASLGEGWRHIEPHHRYAIVGLVPKRGGHVGEYLKKRYVVGRGRDAQEALTTLWRLNEERRGQYGRGRWEYVVLDMHAGKGSLAPTVTESELRARAARGQ